MIGLQMSFKEAINLLEIHEKEVKEIEKYFQSQKERKSLFLILKIVNKIKLHNNKNYKLVLKNVVKSTILFKNKRR